uniref:Uncharacterized protein n=1 Tax=Cacopsylla melanoneura TaxID=428564 RepID=A0A8D8THM5_9HEMI
MSLGDQNSTTHIDNDTLDDSKFVDIRKYVSQLEKRISEQEVLISLLREKLSRQEVASNPGPSGQGDKHVTYSDAVRRQPKSQDSTSTITGSRKSQIAAVQPQSVKYAQFFVTRINPVVSAEVLSRDLISFANELLIKCCKIKTKHSTYSSFHIVVPEDQKHLVSGSEAWPEGVLVKPFVGKLLNEYILESFDSRKPIRQSSPSRVDNIGGTPETSTPTNALANKKPIKAKPTKQATGKTTSNARARAAAAAAAAE